MNERVCRLWAASEARALGHGGITLVSQATGISRKRIGIGLRELDAATDPTVAPPVPPHRVRRAGAGRKPKRETDPALAEVVERLVEPVTRGDPMSPLRWTRKSLTKLAGELCRQGHTASRETVRQVLKHLGYSLQAPQKTREGSSHPDRNAQFEHINTQVEAFQAAAQPVISVDTKKKELVGDFYNKGQEWRPKGEPEQVRTHDFPDPALGKVSPYGVYDVTHNRGWVNVGTDHDTAAFAVQGIRTWWQQMGEATYPQATRLLINCDGGGSNSSRNGLWKTELQRFADESRLEIHVCHFPPGTSKWNKIEHRMFCHITENWRGRPLTDHETIIQLIGSTTTEQGLTIQAALDRNVYPVGIKVTPEELATVALERDAFHGEWNYTIRPRSPGNDTLIS